MALKEFFDKLKTGAVWSAGVSFERANPLPIDKYSVFSSIADAQAYVSENPVAYYGQVIAVVSETDGTHVYTIDEKKQLKEITDENGSDSNNITGGYISNDLINFFKPMSELDIKPQLLYGGNYLDDFTRYHYHYSSWEPNTDITVKELKTITSIKVTIGEQVYTTNVRMDIPASGSHSAGENKIVFGNPRFVVAPGPEDYPDNGEEIGVVIYYYDSYDIDNSYNYYFDVWAKNGPQINDVFDLQVAYPHIIPIKEEFLPNIRGDWFERDSKSINYITNKPGGYSYAKEAKSLFDEITLTPGQYNGAQETFYDGIINTLISKDELKNIRGFEVIISGRKYQVDQAEFLDMNPNEGTPAQLTLKGELLNSVDRTFELILTFDFVEESITNVFLLTHFDITQHPTLSVNCFDIVDVKIDKKYINQPDWFAQEGDYNYINNKCGAYPLYYNSQIEPNTSVKMREYPKSSGVWAGPVNVSESEFDYNSSYDYNGFTSSKELIYDITVEGVKQQGVLDPLIKENDGEKEKYRSSVHIDVNGKDYTVTFVFSKILEVTSEIGRYKLQVQLATENTDGTFSKYEYRTMSAKISGSTFIKIPSEYIEDTKAEQIIFTDMTNLQSKLDSGSLDGAPGKDGLSAYEVAVKNGFVGTEQQWLESLKGETGPQGEPGRDGVDGQPGKDGTNGLPGKDGQDYVLTESDKQQIADIAVTKLPPIVENAKGVAMLWKGTQEEYDLLPTKEETTIYFIKE